MSNLKDQSNLCKKHYVAGLFTGLGAGEVKRRKQAVKLLIADKAEDVDLIETFYTRVDMEIAGLKAELEQSKSAEEAKTWAKDIRDIIENSGFIEAYINGEFVI